MSQSYFEKDNKNQNGYFKEKKFYNLKKNDEKNYYNKDQTLKTREKKVEINFIYNNAKIYRIEKYGLFVNFDNNYSGLLHISKMENVPINYFQINQIITVKIFEILDNKINLQLILDDEMKKIVSINEKSRYDYNNRKNKIVSHPEQPKSYNDLFPSLNATNQDNSNPELNNSSNISSSSTTISPWLNKLDKVKESPISNKPLRNSCFVICSFSNVKILESESIKCQEDINQKVYYFKSIYYACKYNNKFSKRLKIIKSDGKLEFLPDYIYLKKDTSNFNNSSNYELNNRKYDLDISNEETSKLNNSISEYEDYEEEHEDYSDNNEEY